MDVLKRKIKKKNYVNNYFLIITIIIIIINILSKFFKVLISQEE